MEKLTLTKEQLFKAMKMNEQKTEETETKSSGEPKLYKLPSKTITILTERLKNEYEAHYFYRAATNWCKDMNYKKAAAYFEKEASDELVHAEKLQEYMTDFNIIPQIPKADTKHTFSSLIDIIYGAYKIELSLMNEYNKDSHSVFTDDITTFDFLGEFREIQKSSVVEYSDLINATNLIDKTDKFQILYFEQTYF